MKDQKKIGIGISYLRLILNTVINLFLTPLMIVALGDDNYSLYKVMESFAGPLIMFNLGISTIVARSIAICETLGPEKTREKQNTIALAMYTSAAMGLFVAVIGVVMYFLIPSLYGGNYDAEQLKSGQVVFLLFVTSTIFHILTDAFSGCAVGHERFTFNSSMQLLRNVLRAVLIVGAIQFGFGAKMIAAADCITTVTVFSLSAWYALGVLHERPKLTYIDKKELLDMLTFSLAILLQAIVNQVNNSSATIILGALVPDKTIITMYSSALIIYAMYNQIVSTITHFFLPKAAKLITKNATGKDLTDFVVKPGRFQALIALAVVFGFAAVGMDFIQLWIGSKYSTAYYVVLILIVPVTIPLVQSTAIAILDATLKRVYRSLVLVIMAVLNVVLSIVLIHYVSFWGAALGTFISLCIGHILLMNIYYHRQFGMEIVRMFREIFHGILPVSFLTGAIVFLVSSYIPVSKTYFILKGTLFVVMYAIMLWKWALNDSEKDYIIQTIPKRFRGKLVK